MEGKTKDLIKLAFSLSHSQNTNLVLVLIWSVFVLFGCSKTRKYNLNAVQNLQQIHLQLENSSSDSMEILLEKAVYIQTQFLVPDSLRAQTHYYQGKNLYQLGELDSAAVLFYKAISLLGISNLHPAISLFSNGLANVLFPRGIWRMPGN